MPRLFCRGFFVGRIYMWVFFNRDFGDNKRQDIVDIQDETYVKDVLVAEKIAQIVEDPHATYENIQKKKELSAKVLATNKN